MTQGHLQRLRKPVRGGFSSGRTRLRQMALTVYKALKRQRAAPSPAESQRTLGTEPVGSSSPGTPLLQPQDQAVCKQLLSPAHSTSCWLLQYPWETAEEGLPPSLPFFQMTKLVLFPDRVSGHSQTQAGLQSVSSRFLQKNHLHINPPTESPPMSPT